MELYLNEIEDALYEVLPEPTEGQFNKVLIEAMRYSLLCGGKRVRPALTLAFCELCGAKIDRAIPFACAIEMVHTYSLIHDDLPAMDNDDMRRGSPTNHKVFGEDIAILAGDSLLTKAFEIILDIEGKSDDGIIGSARAAEVLAKYSGEKGMVGGQCIDLKVEKNADIEIVTAMDMGKTVALIKAACKMGCIAAGATEEEILAASEYAVGIGMAFQIKDDLLDVLGDAALLGKNVGMDSERYKTNYVSILGIKECERLVKQYTLSAVKSLEAFNRDSSFLKEFALSLADRVK